MRVRELMTSPATTCNPQDSLEHAAHLLWEHDCGALAVIDAKGAVQALLTDRDICMAAYTKGLRLADIAVRDSMSQDLAVCRVRRLPVVDGKGMLVGMLSLADLANVAIQDAQVGRELVQTLSGICAVPKAVSATAQTAAVIVPARPTVGTPPSPARPLTPQK